MVQKIIEVNEKAISGWLIPVQIKVKYLSQGLLTKYLKLLYERVSIE